MTALIDVQLIEGLGLPYVTGAEAALLDPSLDPAFNDAWQALVADFDGLTLSPLFDALPVEQLADLVDATRVGGEEPPNPFDWFTLSCEDEVVDALLPAVQALPLVVFAGARKPAFPASIVSYGTNPDTAITLQIQPAPQGVDAIYAWQVAGGTGDGSRLIDIESGWRLDHDELFTAKTRKVSVFGEREVLHGTAVAGIVVGADNGLGTIGIVPSAELGLVTDDRGIPLDVNSTANAIDVAAADLAAGDVLLLELALPFVPGNKPDVLIEFERPAQNAIRRATARGITVIEPAGNRDMNLDAFPALAHTRPDSPLFSGAIVVGGANLTGAASDTWVRASAFGSRVDCFAAFSRVRAPDHAAKNTYLLFSGTSAASAIIAGVATALQSMTRAANRAPLAPADLRRILSTARLGTLPRDPLLARVGAMPDLRKIIQAQALARVVPIGAAAVGGNALFIVHLDADNHLVRRHFTLLTGWGQPIPLALGNDTFEVNAAQPAVTSTDEVDPLARVVFDAFLNGSGGIHHIFWDTLDQEGNLALPVTPVGAAGHAIAAVRVRLELVVLAAISAEGRVVVVTGDPDVLLAGVSPPLVLDSVRTYRRITGPTLVSRGQGLADLVAIDDAGGLSCFTAALPALVGTGWSPRFTEPSGVVFDPGSRPALLVTGNRLLAAAVGADGSLRVATIDPVAKTVEEPVEVDFNVAIDTAGPVALGLTALNVVVLAVDTSGTLRAATRLITGGDWTPLIPIVSAITLSPLGGVTAVSIDIGVMAIAVGTDGIVCSSISLDGLLWPPLLPLP